MDRESVGFRGSTRNFAPAAGARYGLGGLLQGVLSETAGGACGRPGTCCPISGVAGPGDAWLGSALGELRLPGQGWFGRPPGFRK